MVWTCHAELHLAILLIVGRLDENVRGKECIAASDSGFLFLGYVCHYAIISACGRWYG
jgi:hypothetical protein